MSTDSDTPCNISTKGYSEEPKFPDTQKWQWSCHNCNYENGPPSNMTSYGHCLRCGHERCRECKISWVTDDLKRSPQVILKGSESVVNLSKQVFEHGIEGSGLGHFGSGSFDGGGTGRSGGNGGGNGKSLSDRQGM